MGVLDPKGVLPRNAATIEWYVAPFSTPIVFYEDKRIASVASGTYIQVDEVAFVLTASHVAEAACEAGRVIGISKNRDVNRFTLSSNILALTTLSRGSGHEWGPDLAAIRIPSGLKEDIEAGAGAFYNLSKHRDDPAVLR